jgi:hypothetical protein
MLLALIFTGEVIIQLFMPRTWYLEWFSLAGYFMQCGSLRSQLEITQLFYPPLLPQRVCKKNIHQKNRINYLFQIRELRHMWFTAQLIHRLEL